MSDPASERPRLSAEEARAVLREYPDADLSAFDVEGDVEAIAVEAVVEGGRDLLRRCDEAREPDRG